jgi:hypothetical protein
MANILVGHDVPDAVAPQDQVLVVGVAVNDGDVSSGLLAVFPRTI